MLDLIFKSSFTLVIGLFLCLPLSIVAQNDWKLEKKKNGIEVYTKEAPGWSYVSYLGRGMIEAPFDSVMKVMVDFERRKEWVEDCTTSKIINQSNNQETIIYFVIETPWPTSDRDMVCKFLVDTNKEENAIYHHFTALPHYMPEKDDIVRIKKATGYWKIRKVNDTRTEVSTEGKSETGGDIPEWLVNMFVAENPYNSILNLRRLVLGTD